MRKILLVFFCFCLIGCATIPPPTPEQISNADYGNYPYNYQEVIKDFMDDLLIDPGSAVYSNWRGPSKGWVGNGFQGYVFGYRVCVFVNAKNRMGGYVGKRLYHFVINKGRVIQYHDYVGDTVKLCNF